MDPKIEAAITAAGGDPNDASNLITLFVLNLVRQVGPEVAVQELTALTPETVTELAARHFEKLTPLQPGDPGVAPDRPTFGAVGEALGAAREAFGSRQAQGDIVRDRFLETGSTAAPTPAFTPTPSPRREPVPFNEAEFEFDPGQGPEQFLQPFDPSRATAGAAGPTSAGAAAMAALIAEQEALGNRIITKADGTIAVFDFELGEWISYDVDESGNVFSTGTGDPFAKERAGAAGGQRFGQQFAGIDETTGRAIIFNPENGSITLGEQVGFAGVDPRVEFEAERRLAESEFARDVLSSGGDFLFRQAFNQGLTPQTGFVSMQDLLGQAFGRSVPGEAAGGGGVGGGLQVPGFVPGNAPAAAQRFAAEEAARNPAGQTGGLGARGAQFGAGTADVNPAQTTALAQLSRETLPEGRIRDALGGPGFVSTSGSAIPTPTLQSLSALTGGEAEAANTAALAEFNTPLEDIIQRSRTGFLAPSRSAPARATVR
jgi:hypothetical protein